MRQFVNGLTGRFIALSLTLVLAVAVATGAVLLAGGLIVGATVLVVLMLVAALFGQVKIRYSDNRIAR